MKILFTGILIYCLFSCSNDNASGDAASYTMTITGLDGGPLYFSDYSVADSANEYSINGRHDYLSTNPVCWVQPESGYYIFYFYDYTVTDSGTVVSEVSFGVPAFASGTITNNEAQTSMTPNIISGPKGPHFSFSQMIISLTLDAGNSETAGTIDVTGTDGLRNVHIVGSFRGLHNIK
jgi:hypothetical protein